VFSQLPLCDDPALLVERTVDLTCDAPIDKCEPSKHVVEEEYKMKLAENRRQARELAERKDAEKKRLEEDQRSIMPLFLHFVIYLQIRVVNNLIFIYIIGHSFTE